MNNKKKSEQTRAARTLAFYNAVPNFLWSIIGIGPVFIYCYRHLGNNLLLIFSIISLLPLLLIRVQVDRLQLASSVRWYERLGIHRLNAWTQNGTIIRKRLRHQFGQLSSTKFDSAAVKSLISQTYMYERFHWLALLFFTLVFADALLHSCYAWAITLFLANIIYNICPVLLQQYNRLRLQKLLSRKR